MKIRDRVKELRRVRASDLKPHPKNWRTHSRYQRDVLKGVLADVGIAGALLARDLRDGWLHRVDGPLRAESTPTTELPVLILDLDDREAEQVLLTHDPLASLAGVDEEQLTGLLETNESSSQAVQEMFAKLARTIPDQKQLLPEELEIPPSFQIVIEVEDEKAQQVIYERMREEGFKCRVLTL